MMGCVSRQVRFTDHLPSVVEPPRVAEGPAESADVRRAAVLVPEDWIDRRAAIHVELPHGLPASVHQVRRAIRAAKRVQVVHDAVLPKKRPGLSGKTKKRGRVGYGVRRNSDNLAAAVNVERNTLIAAERAQVGDLAVAPEDCLKLRYPQVGIGDAVFRGPNYRPTSIDALGKAVVAAGQRPQVRQGAVLPLKRLIDVAVRKPQWTVEAPGIRIGS